MKRFRIRVYGRVHMVGFRWSAKDKADQLGIAGFVQNEEDGSVTLEVEGEEEALKGFLRWCRRGPEAAKVERIEVEGLEPVFDKDFQIL